MQEGLINLNLEGVDDGSDPLPEGLRLMRIKSADRKHKEGSEYPYIEVRMNPLDLPGSEKRSVRLTLSFHPDAQWNLKRFVKAAGIPFNAAGFYMEDFVGKELYVTLKITPDRNDPEIKRNEVGPPYSRAV